MAGLDEVLRTFALQKMQELRDKHRNEDEVEPAPNNYNRRQSSTEAVESKESKAKSKQENSQSKGEHSNATSKTKGNIDISVAEQAKTSGPTSELIKAKVDEKSTRESIPVQTESAKDGKDKKITIKLFTKKIEPAPLRQKDEKEVVAEEDEEEDDSSSDSSDSEDEVEVKDGKPWRMVYEEGELSPSSESEQEEEGDEEGDEEEGVNAEKEDDEMDTDTSGEIKDELRDPKKSKKHKKHKHKKHKHSKDKVRDSELMTDKEKHKDKSKKEKKKEKKEHKDRSKDKEKGKDRDKIKDKEIKSKDKEKSKGKKKSKDKDKEDTEQDKDAEENDSEKEKHKEKSEKKESKDKKHKSKLKDKGSDKGETKKSSSKRKHKSGSRSRSRSPAKSKSASHKKQKHSRSRSRSPKSRRHSESTRSRDRGYYRNDSPDRFYNRRYNTGSRYRNRSRSRSRSPHSGDEFIIDKAKLLEIAKANAYAKMQSGEFPPYMKLTPKSVVTIVESKERSSVEELTAVCKEISSKQQDYSDSDDSPVNRPVGSDEESDEPFIRHPFKVREAPVGHVGIIMNIKNAIQKPIQDKEMLRLTFPVSSGSQHRKKEDEIGPKPYGDWVSVEKKPKMMDPVAKPITKLMPIPGTVTLTAVGAAAAVAAAEALVAPDATPATVDAAAAAAATAAMPPPPVPPPTTVVAPPVAAATPPAPPPAPLTFAGIISPAGALPTSSAIAAASAIPAAAAAAEYASAAAAAAVSKAMAAAQAAASMRVAASIRVAATPPVIQTDMSKEDKVFEEIPSQKVDIAAMVSARLKAARRLENNPNDVEALSVMHKAQTQIRNWTMGKQKPGMFTGDTGLKTLRPEELANTDPRAQAWAKRDMFHNQTPLKGGNKGAMLMAKMGWRQGEGLGKNNEGTLEPLALDVKTDRKGLVAGDEQRRKKNQVPKAVFKDLSGKHPVSALMEICNKRRWPPPAFDLVQDKGPAHKKNFVFKVRINNEEYQPAISCPNKKQAKAQAAAVALQKMGLIPADQPV